MYSERNDIYVLYHGPNCTDGYAAAFAAWLKMGDRILPEIEDKDLRIEVFRPASYVKNLNRASTAVRAVHEPTKRYAECQDFISQHQNRKVAIRKLKEKLAEEQNLPYVFYIPINPTGPLPEIPDYSKVYMLDVSRDPEELEGLVWTKDIELTVIDHHATAISKIKSHASIKSYETEREIAFKYILDKTKSGAMLSWEYFHPNKPVPDLFKFVQDADLWEWKLDRSKEISAAIWFKKRNPETFYKWEKYLTDTGLNNLFEEGKIIKTTEAINTELLCRHTIYYDYYHKQDKRTYKLAAVNSPVLQSNIGDYLVTKIGADIGLIWYENKDGAYQVSLRSNKESDVDVSKIAEPYGGGGHKGAAGVTCTNKWWVQ